MRVAVILGTRPEAIKLGPVVRALRDERGIPVTIVATAQHRELLDGALHDAGLAADVDLDLMAPDQSLSAFAGRCLAAVGEVLARERPDYVIAQGDTTTVLAAALAACHARLAFGHVEAGLRSHADTPFPEEANRTLVARLARHHFCPTPLARANLLAEGIAAEAIHVTGNPVVDALRAIAATLPAATTPPGRTILVTLHRRENHGAVGDVVAALRAIVDRLPDVSIVWPLHPNPRVADPAQAALAGHPRIRLVPPLSHRDLVAMLRDCWLVMTDSGGLQEEAPALGRPVLILRRETERPEGVMAGVARLVGTDPVAIVAAVEALASDPAAYARMATAVSPYGDGAAGSRIAGIIADHLHGRPALREGATSG